MTHWRFSIGATVALMVFLDALPAHPASFAPFTAPYRVTSHPAEDYMPAVSPDGKILVFVSNREGAPNLWIKSLNSPEIPTPKRITFQAAGDKDPVFSPDGKQIAYVSYSSDAEGDLYLLTLPKLNDIAKGIVASPERLTGIATADREPAFTADGRGVIFTSVPKDRSGPANLWILDLATKKRRPLTSDGARQATASPDGGSVAFVGGGTNEKSALYLLDLKSGEKRLVTDGAGAIDAFPAFDGASALVFVRYQSDTNGDGEITIDDRSALFRKNLAQPDAPPVPLTPFDDRYDLFPAPAGRSLYYSAQHAGGVDLFRIPFNGLFAPSGDFSSDFIKAAKAVDYYRNRKSYRRLAWQVFWSAHARCDTCKDGLAESLYRLALIEQEVGDTIMARHHLNYLIDRYPKILPWAGFAEIALITNDLRLNPAMAVKKLKAVRAKYQAIPRVEARADLALAKLNLKLNEPTKALALLRGVVADYSNERAEAAEAMFQRNEVYRMMGDQNKMIAAWLDVIREYPDQEKWADRAAEMVIDLAIKKDAPLKTSTLALNQIIESDDTPVALKAVALNRIAALYYNADETARARETYQMAVDRFGDQRRTKNEALFSIAKILTEEERFPEALSIYKKIEQDTENKREVYVKARRAFIDQSLNKALYEQKTGDIRLALKTYSKLIEYDPAITEAHRGVISLSVAIGKTKEVIAEYEKRLLKNPTDATSLYALGLALTYIKPLPIDRAEALVKTAIAKDETNPWYHQTLGWLFERRELEYKDGDWAEQAEQSYLHALALSDIATHPGQEADLRLNLGNVYYSLSNCSFAVTHFSRREALAVRFAERASASLFYQRWGECQFRLGDDEEAIKLFERAYSYADDDIFRKIVLNDRIGLALQSGGKYFDAAKRFKKSLSLREKSGKTGERGVVLRNIANNIYFGSKDAPVHNRDEKLKEALSYYLKSEEAFIDFKRKKRKGSGALIDIEVKTGAGGIKSAASKGFSVEEEKKLVVHHIGKIYGELGDYKRAAKYFEKKLSFVPSELALIDNAPVLTEKSIVLNQLGVYRFYEGFPEEAIRRLSESMALCQKLLAAACIVKNTAAMARVALNSDSKLRIATVDKLIKEGSLALDSAIEAGVENIFYTASTLNLYGQLYHRRLTARMRMPASSSVEANAAELAAIAYDANNAEKFYTKSRNLYKSIKTADALLASLRVSINLASLLADLGKDDEARKLFDEVAKKSEETFSNGPRWEADVTRYIYYPGDKESDNWLKTARRALGSIPFGYQLTDNKDHTLALIKTLYEKLGSGRPIEERVALLEERKSNVVKFLLGKLVESKTIDDAVPGIDILRKTYNEYRLLQERAATGAENINVRFDKWFVMSEDAKVALRKLNPLLADIAYPAHRDLFVYQSSLEDDEAILYVLGSNEKAHGYLMVDQERELFDLSKKSDRDRADALLTKYKKSRLYVITDRPLTGKSFSQFTDNYTIATVPSLSTIAHVKAARNINDYHLLAVGEFGELVKTVAGSFLDIDLIENESGKESSAIDKLSATGLLLVGHPPEMGWSITDTKFGNKNFTVTAEKLLSNRHRGYLLLSPAPRDAGESEGALFTLALLAGYPSWVLLPEKKEEQNSLLSFFLPIVRGASLPDALRITKEETGLDVRLVGAFGFSVEERTRYSSENFKSEIKKAVAYMKAEKWLSAGNAFERAYMFTLITSDRRYDEPLFGWMSEAFFRVKRYKKASAYQQKLVAGLREKGKKIKLAEALLTSGAIYTELGSFDKAVADIGAALDIFRDEDKPELMIAASSQLGAAEERYYRYDRALIAYEHALDVSGTMNRNVLRADALRRVGRVYNLRLNQFDNARSAYRDAIELYESEGEAKRAIATMIELGAVDVDAGALNDAQKVFIAALSRAEKMDDEKLVGLAWFHLANVAWFRGDYKAALDRIEKSIDDATKRGDRHKLAIALNSMGLIYWTLNNYPKALEAMERSLQIARAINSELDEASALNNIGLVYRSAGKLVEAKNSFMSARAIDERLKSDWGVAYDARNISIVALMMGETALARQYADEAVRLTKKIGDKINGAKALLQRAKVEAVEGQWTDALDTFRETRNLALAGGLKDVLWRAYRGEGEALKATGAKKDAIEIYKKGVEVVEKMRAALKADQLRQGFLDDKQELYEELILLLVGQNEINKAFEFAERARGRGFIDLLGTSPPKLHNELEQKAYEAILSLRRKADELERGGEAVSEKYREISAELENALSNARENFPDLVPFVSVEPAKAEALLDAIGDDVALLEYLVTKKVTVLFIAASGRIEVILIPVGRKKLAGMVDRYRKIIQDGAPVGETSKELGKLLVGPVMKRLEKFDVIGVVPHGPLHYLSFAAIETDGAYLIDHKSLFYAPSASLFLKTRMRRSEIAPSLMNALSVGDPDLGSFDTELPLAEFEARSLTWIFPRVKVLIGKAATESAVTMGADRYQIIHIASHGLFDPQAPLNSALYLTPDKTSDGALTVGEIFSMNVEADLVTLSACQTGLGAVSKGDEVVGLNRAFFYAGAHTIVSTLWRVDDMASAILIKKFYRNLMSLTKARALRKAQLSVKRRFAHPANWAGFTLIGDYR